MPLTTFHEPAKSHLLLDVTKKNNLITNKHLDEMTGFLETHTTDDKKNEIIDLFKKSGKSEAEMKKEFLEIKTKISTQKKLLREGCYDPKGNHGFYLFNGQQKAKEYREGMLNEHKLHLKNFHTLIVDIEKELYDVIDGDEEVDVIDIEEQKAYIRQNLVGLPAGFFDKKNAHTKEMKDVLSGTTPFGPKTLAKVFGSEEGKEGKEWEHLITTLTDQDFIIQDQKNGALVSSWNFDPSKNIATLEDLYTLIYTNLKHDEASVASLAVVDEPVVDEPIVDEPVVDEPIVDEPVVDEPIVDEPIVDEPIVDEPIVDEPIVESISEDEDDEENDDDIEEADDDETIETTPFQRETKKCGDLYEEIKRTAEAMEAAETETQKKYVKDYFACLCIQQFVDTSTRPVASADLKTMMEATFGIYMDTDGSFFDTEDKKDIYTIVTRIYAELRVSDPKELIATDVKGNVTMAFNPGSKFNFYKNCFDTLYEKKVDTKKSKAETPPVLESKTTPEPETIEKEKVSEVVEGKLDRDNPKSVVERFKGKELSEAEKKMFHEYIVAHYIGVVDFQKMYTTKVDIKTNPKGYKPDPDEYITVANEIVTNAGLKNDRALSASIKQILGEYMDSKFIIFNESSKKVTLALGTEKSYTTKEIQKLHQTVTERDSKKGPDYKKININKDLLQTKPSKTDALLNEDNIKIEGSRWYFGKKDRIEIEKKTYSPLNFLLGSYQPLKDKEYQGREKKYKFENIELSSKKSGKKVEFTLQIGEETVTATSLTALRTAIYNQVGTLVGNDTVVLTQIMFDIEKMLIKNLQNDSGLVYYKEDGKMVTMTVTDDNVLMVKEGSSKKDVNATWKTCEGKDGKAITDLLHDCRGGIDSYLTQRKESLYTATTGILAQTFEQKENARKGSWVKRGLNKLNPLSNDNPFVFDEKGYAKFNQDEQKRIDNRAFRYTGGSMVNVTGWIGSGIKNLGKISKDAVVDGINKKRINMSGIIGKRGGAERELRKLIYESNKVVEFEIELGESKIKKKVSMRNNKLNIDGKSYASWAEYFMAPTKQDDVQEVYRKVNEELLQKNTLLMGDGKVYYCKDEQTGYYFACQKQGEEIIYNTLKESQIPEDHQGNKIEAGYIEDKLDPKQSKDKKLMMYGSFGVVDIMIQQIETHYTIPQTIYEDDVTAYKNTMLQAKAKREEQAEKDRRSLGADIKEARATSELKKDVAVITAKLTGKK